MEMNELTTNQRNEDRGNSRKECQYAKVSSSDTLGEFVGCSLGKKFFVPRRTAVARDRLYLNEETMGSTSQTNGLDEREAILGSGKQI